MSKKEEKVKQKPLIHMYKKGGDNNCKCGASGLLTRYKIEVTCTKCYSVGAK